MIKDNPTRKLAIGYFFNRPFVPTIEPYSESIKEVYYAWPGLLASRHYRVDPERQKQILAHDLRWCRRNGIKLDLLLNAFCFGDDACSDSLADTIADALKMFDSMNLLPEVITTTSPFVAMTVKKHFPHIDVRASVLLRLGSIMSLEYMSEYFDSFYLRRDIQRDLPTVKMFHEWAQKHGKKISMLVNMNCLRDCPWQTFHANLLAHRFDKICDDCDKNGFVMSLCHRKYSNGEYVEFLRGSWIRPEDTHLFEPYLDCLKLSTRDIAHPEKAVKAYAEHRWDGDLLEIVDPGFQYERRVVFDNTAFPADWATSGIGGKCASNCTHCGRCEEVLAKIMRQPEPEPEPMPEVAPSFTITVKGGL